MWLFIEALDVWMFRDGKPFNAGEGHLANSIFPPTAHTVQGALRALMLDYLAVDLKAYITGQAPPNVYDLLGNPRDPLNPLGGFSIQGPFIAKRYGSDPDHDPIERYVPLPQDVTADKNADLRFRTTPLHMLHPTDERLWIDGYHLRTLDVTLRHETPTGLWLAEGAFKQYLTGTELTVDDCVHESDLFVREYRSGNAMDLTTRRVRAEEGMLYSGMFIRPVENVGLLVWVPDHIAEKLPNQASWRFGGEGRSARITKITDASRVSPQSPFDHGWRSESRLKVVLLTPTYFGKGWLPNAHWFLDTLQAAALTHPVRLGGWDLAHHRPRPIHRFVPAGSVYYLDFQDEQPPDSLLICDPLPVDDNTSIDLPLDQLGLGHVAIGIW